MTIAVDPEFVAVAVDADVSDIATGNELRRHNSQDHLRFRAMFEAHFDGVCLTLRRFCVPTREIEDAAQQVFVVAWNKLAKIELGRERAFLLGTAWNVASHSKRTHSRRREVWDDEDTSAEMVDPAVRSDELVEQKQTRALLDQVLAAMPEELRVVLVLHELEELTRDEIALALGWRPGTVASRLERAREEFSRLSARAIQSRGGRR